MDELREYLAASAEERLEMRVRRLVDQIMEPETRRIEGLIKSGASVREIEAAIPITEAEVTKRVLELMELAVTERVHEINWTQEFTPTTLRKAMQQMRKVKVPPLDPDPVLDRWKRMMLTQAGMIDHNAFVTVAEPTEEPMYKSEARPGWMK